MELEKIHSCDHCGAVAGKKRPVGNYIVELFPFEQEGELKLLCISCFKYYRKLALKAAMDEERKEEEIGFFTNLKWMYQKAFHSEEKEPA